jgi:hypothetical protein
VIVGAAVETAAPKVERTASITTWQPTGQEARVRDHWG